MDTEQPEAGSDVLERMSAHFGAPAETPEAEDAPVDLAATLESTDPNEAEAPADEEPEQEPQAGLVEVETDEGEKYQVPAKLKDAFLRQKDYTQKTQELAELRKQAAVSVQHQQAVAQFQQAVSGEQAELARLQGDLSKYKALNWGDLDVETYIKARHQMDTLKERVGEVEQAIGKKAQAFQAYRQQQVQEITQSATTYLKQTIPTWGPSAQAAARQQAQEVGYTDAEMAEVFDPRFVRLAWKAAQYDQLQASKPAAVQKAQAAPPVIKPGASQGASVAKEAKYKEQRERFKKSGDIRDGAKLLLMR